MSVSSKKVRKDEKSLGFIKPNFVVTQKNLIASWAFPASRMEEFMSLFQQAVYNVVVEMMSDIQPVPNPAGENHPKDARLFVEAMKTVIGAAKFGYRTTPYYCEVDYFFWIVGGMVCFGCVLPGSESIDERYISNLKWIKTPWEIVRGGQRLSGKCPEGVIPSYVRLLSFKPGEMVGIQELARRMVRNPKERDWAIQYALRTRAAALREDRKEQSNFDREAQEKRLGGAALIVNERHRQINEEGYKAEHDDKHDKRELVRAAREYAKPGVKKSSRVPAGWPWKDEFWKPADDEVWNLVRAGALIAAEIDRVLRKTVAKSPARTMQEVFKKEESGV